MSNIKNFIFVYSTIGVDCDSKSWKFMTIWSFKVDQNGLNGNEKRWKNAILLLNMKNFIFVYSTSGSDCKPKSWKINDDVIIQNWSKWYKW